MKSHLGHQSAGFRTAVILTLSLGALIALLFLAGRWAEQVPVSLLLAAAFPPSWAGWVAPGDPSLTPQVDSSQMTTVLAAIGVALALTAIQIGLTEIVLRRISVEEPAVLDSLPQPGQRIGTEPRRSILAEEGASMPSSRVLELLARYAAGELPRTSLSHLFEIVSDAGAVPRSSRRPPVSDVAGVQSSGSQTSIAGPVN